MLRTEALERGTFELLKTLMSDEKLNTFNLVGGTALALYMGHRQSIDLDLFTQSWFDTEKLEIYLVERYDFKTSGSKKRSDATLFGYINGIKTDWIWYKYLFVKPVLNCDGIRLCSVADIAAMKLTAISQDGTRLKDFVDIACLSVQLSLKEMLNAFECKYPNTNSMAAVKGLTYFEDIDFSVKIDLMNTTYCWRKVEKRLKEMIKYPEKIFADFPEKI